MTTQVAVKPAKSKETKENKKERAKEKEKEKEFFKELFDWKLSWETRGIKASEASEMGYPPAMDVEARVAALEARLTALEPFIDASQRPDLRLSALADEPDIELIRGEIEDDILRAKRLYDTKPREY